MSSLFRLPHNGELLWSAVSRLHGRLTSISARTVTEMLFRIPADHIGKLLPYGLKSFTEICDHPELSVESVVSQNTIFPFIAPFLHPNDTTKIFHSLLSDVPPSRGWSAKGMKRSGFGERGRMALRYCPECFRKAVT